MSYDMRDEFYADGTEIGCVTPAAALAERQLEAYQRAVREAWKGEGRFWSDGYANDDGELTVALRLALASVGTTECDRWRIVARELGVQIDKFAATVAEATR